MMTSLSIIRAMVGKSSQISMPGTLVAMGVNSPRTSAGASGLRSHMSMCGGPPGRYTLMTARWEWRMPEPASAASRLGSDRPPPSRLPPIVRKSRRERPAQAELRLRPKIVSMLCSCQKLVVACFLQQLGDRLDIVQQGNGPTAVIGQGGGWVDAKELVQGSQYIRRSV